MRAAAFGSENECGQSRTALACTACSQTRCNCNTHVRRSAALPRARSRLRRRSVVEDNHAMAALRYLNAPSTAPSMPASPQITRCRRTPRHRLFVRHVYVLRLPTAPHRGPRLEQPRPPDATALNNTCSIPPKFIFTSALAIASIPLGRTASLSQPRRRERFLRSALWLAASRWLR